MSVRNNISSSLSTTTEVEKLSVEGNPAGRDTMSEKNDTENAIPAPVITPVPNLAHAAPDGGLEGWLVVTGAWCCSFCSFGWINSVGVFQDYYQTHSLKQYSSSTISWIVCLQIFFLFAMSPVVGKLYDNYGPRWILLSGSFLHVFGLMMMSISTEYYQILLSQGVCSAIGASAVFAPAFNCVVGYFDKKRAAAFGILATGSSTGGVIFPIMLSHLIERIGFGWALRISAFLILLLLTIANLTIRTRLTPTPKALSFKEFIHPFTELTFSLSVIGNFLYTFGVFAPITYIVVQATADGMGSRLAQYLVAMLNAASLFGRLSAGLLADKVGRFNIFIIVGYITTILILGLWIPATGNAAIIVFSVLFGYFSGAYASLGPALVAQISPIQDIGVRTGVFFAIASISGLTSGPIAGAIYADSNGSFLGVKVFSGILCLTGSTFILCARVSKTGFRLLAKF